ncbi:hypothetical protein ACWED2_10075 [Amycolatopsis sp. NPDC005003]
MSVGGSTALVLALLAEATREGSWAAITGMPEVGVVAAAELGVELDRLALAPNPGAELVAVVSALIDGSTWSSSARLSSAGYDRSWRAVSPVGFATGVRCWWLSVPGPALTSNCVCRNAGGAV